jgi:threonine/homoserine/homoserine lactone efflux protein
MIIGVSIAAPVGPIGVLCIRRTLADGRLPGLVSGLGAATADALYGMVAAFGLTFISDLLLARTTLLQLAGGLFLAYLGIKTLLAPPVGQVAAADNRRGLAGAYTSTLALTLANPMTVLAFLGIFAGLGAGAAEGYGAASVMVAGVFAGSALWWLTLSMAVGLFRARFDARWMRWVNRISGVIILIFALNILRQLMV